MAKIEATKSEVTVTMTMTGSEARALWLSIFPREMDNYTAQDKEDRKIATAIEDDLKSILDDAGIDV